MADNSDNWKYSFLTDTGFNPKSNALSFMVNGTVDLLQYFGINRNITTDLLMDCHGTDIVEMSNNSKIELYNVRFSDWLTVYETYKDDYNESITYPRPTARDPRTRINPAIKSKDMLFRLIPSKYSLSVTQKYIYIDPKFILVFINGRYTKDWHCVDSTLIFDNLYNKDKQELEEELSSIKSVEIYLLKNFDYNIQDETHYYSSEIPEVGFTFNNLRKNQFMEHHLIANEFLIFEGLGLSSYLKYDTINTRHLLQFAKSKFTYKNVITSNNVVQNQSETYEDIIIRKKLCDNIIIIDGKEVPDTKWATDFSLWKGVDDIYSTSNSSSTMLYDQFGHLIDPIAIDWFNRRLAPYGDYDYVEIQHPSDRVYTGEIYFPASDHDPEEHIQRDPENPYRYKYLYETNYKLVYLPNGNPYEYDTYFRKIFETLHMEETVYVLDKNETYNEYTFTPVTKKTENLLLDDILMNKLYGDGDDDDENANVVTDLISVQIQSDTSFIRREILTSKKIDGVINSNLQNDLKVEVPKTDSMLVFVDGKYQFSDTYSIDDTDDGKHYIILSDEFAGETPETTQSHIVTVFYYNKNNRANFCNLKFAKNSQNYAENIKNLKNIFNQVALFEHRILLNGNIVTKEYSPIIVYMKFNGSIDELNTNLSDMGQNNLVDGTSTKSNLIAKAIKLASSINYGSLCLIKMDKSFINLNDISIFIDDSTADLVFDDGCSYPIDGITSIFDLVTVCFYDSDNVYNELPLSFLINNDIFSDFELDAYLFDISFNDGCNGSFNVSIDKCHFNNNDQGFAVNNLRKNIYMEHYGISTVFHSLKFDDISIIGKKDYIYYTNIVFSPMFFINSSLIKMCEFRGVLNNFDTVDNNLYYGSIPVRNFINDSLIGYNSSVYDHVDWIVDEENFTVSFTYHFDFTNSENIQIIITENELPVDEYENIIFNEPIITNFTANENVITITYYCDDLESTRIKQRELIRCYIYTREQDLDLSLNYDSIRNNVYKLEKEMNRFSSMVFDKSGYLISPDSIDWVFTEFNYPMNDNQISILPLNSYYPAVIGELHENSLERAQIMDLCLNDMLMFVDSINAENVIIWKNRLIGDEEDGLRNISVVPVDYEIQNTSVWENLCNNDYVYWMDYETEEDVMKIIVNIDDYIEENIFAFVNGIKVSNEDFEKNDDRHMYKVHNYTKYRNPRYKMKKYGKINDDEDIVYIDSNGRYTFEETETLISMDDESPYTKAKEIDINNVFENTEILCLAGNQSSSEIVCYNYNPDDIEYVISENITVDGEKTYVFSGYYDYDLRRYALVFINGIRYKHYMVEDEELKMNLKADDHVEIYVFKKFDYNWTDEVRYQQYIDDRYFSVHNMKTLRMI